MVYAATANEQLMLELLNRARLDPAGEAARFGIDLNEGLAPGTLSSAARQPLAMNELILAAARGHSSWMIANDVFSHTGAGGSSPFDRMDAAGYAFTGSWGWGENISWRGTTGIANLSTMIVTQHQSLFVDANIAGRGHRLAMLNDGFREVGIGQTGGVFTSNGINYNASMVTQDFGRSGSAVFILGVAYDDGDGNAFYSVGEGRSGVNISVGASSTDSGASGGYTLAVTSGIQTVTFSGGGIATPMTVEVDTSGGNVKLDIENGNHILSSGSLTLGAGASAVTLLGVADLNVTGSSASDIITGNSGANNLDGGDGADAIDGGLGADTMTGGDGSDLYYVDNVGDVVSETTVNVAIGGTDRVIASITYTLPVNVENLTMVGTGNIVGNGNGSNNFMTGNAQANTLRAWGGNDVFLPGAGNDWMSGGIGQDYFVFNTSLGPNNRDGITDFSHADDTIRLENAIFTGLGVATGTLSAAAFHAGTAAHDGDDRIIYNAANGQLLYDADGLGGTAAVLFATLTNRPTNIDHTDFVII